MDERSANAHLDDSEFLDWQLFCEAAQTQFDAYGATASREGMPLDCFTLEPEPTPPGCMVFLAGGVGLVAALFEFVRWLA